VPNSLSPDEEDALIMQVATQPDAIRRLYRQYFPRVFAYVASRVATQQDAEDVTSDIFLKVVESISRFEYRGAGSFAAWLFRIAHNTVTQFYRVDDPTTLLDALPDLPSADLPPDEVLSRKERFAQLKTLISELAPRRREIVTLRFFGGLRNQEIAAVLGLDERTVASHLCRALEDLQHKYQQEGLIDD